MGPSWNSLGLLGPNLGLPMSLRPWKTYVIVRFLRNLLFDRLGLISPILTSRSPTWNRFGGILGHLGPILGPSWKDPPRPSMHFFFSLSLGVAPKPHLNDLEPHLRAHPPHLQLSPAHLSLVPAHLGHLHPILVHLGPKFGLLGPSDGPPTWQKPRFLLGF